MYAGNYNFATTFSAIEHVRKQARNQTFPEGGSKFGMVAHMKWAL